MEKLKELTSQHKKKFIGLACAVALSGSVLPAVTTALASDSENDSEIVYCDEIVTETKPTTSYSETVTESTSLVSGSVVVTETTTVEDEKPAESTTQETTTSIESYDYSIMPEGFVDDSIRPTDKVEYREKTSLVKYPGGPIEEYTILDPTLEEGVIKVEQTPAYKVYTSRDVFVNGKYRYTLEPSQPSGIMNGAKTTRIGTKKTATTENQTSSTTESTTVSNDETPQTNQTTESSTTRACVPRPVTSESTQLTETVKPTDDVDSETISEDSTTEQTSEPTTSEDTTEKSTEQSSEVTTEQGSSDTVESTTEQPKEETTEQSSEITESEQTTTSTPKEESKPVEETSSTNKQESKKVERKEELPKTGDTSSSLLLAGFTTLLAAIGLSRKSKKD